MTLETVPQRPMHPAFSIPSILAAVCAVASFYRGWGLGFVLAVAAIIFGALGMLIAFLPGKRGGIVSVVSIVFGLAGLLAAVGKLVF